MSDEVGEGSFNFLYLSSPNAKECASPEGTFVISEESAQESSFYLG